MSASQARMFSTLILFIAFVAAASSARAEVRWQVVILHPQGAENSQALAADGGRQGGTMEIGIVDHPAIWSRRANSVIDLLSDPWKTGGVGGMDGGLQAGDVSDYYTPHALLWHGSPDDYVDLNPGEPYRSARAVGAANGQQVGYGSCRCDGEEHAMLWRGTPESYIDLHPIGARYSVASATDGEYQGGEAYIVQARQGHATLWHGAAESFVDMHPSGANSSTIIGMAPGIQVGSGLFGPMYQRYEHALLWHGTSESVVDLHPPNVLSSRAYATTGTIHVGYIAPQSNAEAGFWTGDDPNSFFNLQPLLPPGWSRSSARAVSVVGPRIYIAGAALAPNGKPQAVLWIGTTVETKEPARAPKP